MIIPLLEDIALVKLISQKWSRNIPVSVVNQRLNEILPPSSNKKKNWLSNAMEKEVTLFKETIEGFLELQLEINEIYWNQSVTINKLKVTEDLLINDNIAIKKRFYLASSICEINYITHFWNLMNAEEVEHLFFGENEYLLVAYWSYLMANRLGEFEEYIQNTQANGSLLECMFHNAIESANLTACTYFMKQLTPVQKNNCLKNATLRIFNKLENSFTNNYTSIIFDLLMKELDPEYKLKIIKRYPCIMLKICLFWPYQELFFNVYKDVHSLLNETDFLQLALSINSRIEANDYNYTIMFKIIFAKIPSQKKIDLIIKKDRAFGALHLLLNPLGMKSDKIIDVLLNDIPAADRKKLMFGLPRYTKHFIRNKKWEMLRCLLVYCILSKEDLITFENIITAYIMGDVNNPPDQEILINFVEFQIIINDMLANHEWNKQN